jgi:putative tricarboxylic transport membrane protein
MRVGVIWDGSRIMGAAAAVVGAVAVALASGLEEGTATGGPGARFLPMLLGGLMILLGVTIAFGPDGGRSARPAPAAETDPGSGRRTLMTVGAMAVYTLLLDRLGFLLATSALLVVLMRAYGERRWVVVLSVALCATGATYGLFAGWLKVPLPPGLLAP